jgi:23S rRNA (guanosine2251-2'-O)-methyltransferase
LHAVLAALINPRRRVHRLCATAEVLSRHGAEISAAEGVPAAEAMSRHDIDRLLPPGAVHQGLAAWVDPLPAVALADVCAAAGAQAAVVVLDQVTDPQNIGAVLRSAAALGAVAVVVPEHGAAPVSGAVAKAASGALEVVPLVRVTNLRRALDHLKAATFWCAGLDAEAETTLAEANLGGRVAIVLGAEGTGLRRLTRETCDLMVRVPISGPVESLNVSNTAAIALYELARQTG